MTILASGLVGGGPPATLTAVHCRYRDSDADSQTNETMLEFTV